MSQFGKCNVCTTPCASCMRLALELLAVESTSDSFSNESYEQEASCEQVSETSASSSRKCEGGILDSNNDDSSFVEGAGLSLSVEYQRIDMDKMNKTEELCTCSQRESSSSIIMVRSENEEHRQDAVGSAKSIKFEFSEDSATEFVNSFNHDGGIIPIEQSNAEKPCQVSEFVRCDSESSLSGYVKICEICGDAGHKEFLAVCSKCHVGAEHIYCMRTMLDSAPDSIWMCEECVLSDKMMKTKFEKFVACPMYISSNQSYQGGEISTSSDFKVLPDINTEGLDVDKSRGDETSSLLHANRTAGLVTCRSTTKSLALGIESGPDFLSSDHSKAQAQDFKIKASHELSLSNDLSSRTRSIQEKSGQHLPKPHQLQMATGVKSLPFTDHQSKSKSFNDSEKRPKVQWLGEIPQHCKFFNATHNKKKGSRVRTMRNALSSNYGSSGHSNVLCPKRKRIPPNISEDVSLKKLRCMKEHTPVGMTSKSRFKRPQVGSTKDGTFVSASSCDKKFGFHSEISSPSFYGTKYQGPKAVQISNDSATASNENAVCLRVAEVIQDVLLPTISDASQEVKHKGETSCHSLEYNIPYRCSDAIGEENLTVLQTSSNGTEKVHKTSFILTSECISNRSGSEYYSRTGSLDHASNCHRGDSTSFSVLDTTMLKDMHGSSQMDVDPSFCNQMNACRTLAVPMIDYIWKGELEIPNSLRVPRVLYKIQAHLSTRASSKIPEAVMKFSDKLILEKVSRLNAWPIQFQEYYPQDDSIGLYFFAQDIESYGNYKSLLQCMVDSDIALIGNCNGIELLIFSSHLLPENSRGWNGLLFLWGVFKERKVNGSKYMPCSYYKTMA